jgi:hypothetical protein
VTINVCREPVSGQVEVLAAVVIKSSVFWDVHGVKSQDRELFGFKSNAHENLWQTLYSYRYVDGQI